MVIAVALAEPKAKPTYILPYSGLYSHASAYAAPVVSSHYVAPYAGYAAPAYGYHGLGYHGGLGYSGIY